MYAIQCEFQINMRLLHHLSLGSLAFHQRIAIAAQGGFGAFLSRTCLKADLHTTANATANLAAILEMFSKDSTLTSKKAGQDYPSTIKVVQKAVGLFWCPPVSANAYAQLYRS